MLLAKPPSGGFDLSIKSLVGHSAKNLRFGFAQFILSVNVAKE